MNRRTKKEKNKSERPIRTPPNLIVHPPIPLSPPRLPLSPRRNAVSSHAHALGRLRRAPRGGSAQGRAPVGDEEALRLVLAHPLQADALQAQQQGRLALRLPGPRPRPGARPLDGPHRERRVRACLPCAFQVVRWCFLLKERGECCVVLFCHWKKEEEERKNIRRSKKRNKHNVLCLRFDWECLDLFSRRAIK